MKFEYPKGATPIDPDEAEGLIPTHITLQKELNEWEQQNITDAALKHYGKKYKLTLPRICRHEEKGVYSPACSRQVK